MKNISTKVQEIVQTLLVKYKLTKIEEKSGIGYWRLDRIKRTGKGGNELDLQKLQKAFPELIEYETDNTTNPTKLENRISQLETDNRLLKEMMIKLLMERGDIDKAEEIKKLK